MRTGYLAMCCGAVILYSTAARAAIFTGEDRTPTVEIAAGFDDKKTSTLNDFSDGNQTPSVTDDNSSITATATVDALTSYTATQYNYNIQAVSDAKLTVTNAFFDSDLSFHFDTESAYDASGTVAFTQATTGGGLVPAATVELRLFQSGNEFRDLFLSSSGPFDFSGVLPAGDYTIRIQLVTRANRHRHRRARQHRKRHHLADWHIQRSRTGQPAAARHRGRRNGGLRNAGSEVSDRGAREAQDQTSGCTISMRMTTIPPARIQ